MRRFVILLVGVCLVVFFLSQSFHDLLPHVVKGDDHITTVHHNHPNHPDRNVGDAARFHISHNEDIDRELGQLRVKRALQRRTPYDRPAEKEAASHHLPEEEEEIEEDFTSGNGCTFS